ncbi:MAG: fasciclin domain-containing protein, partial [Bacteroidaceae bacterium]|nr:fasciclin domain-containing protein [Bacteroidaceae bacterium]
LFNTLKAESGTEPIVLFTDASTPAPMIHFTGRFLKGNKLESADVDFLYNQAPGTRQSDDVYINESKVILSDIFCKNGFIHQVDKVILPLDNMAEVIRQSPTMKKFSRIIERFAAPDYQESLTKAYNNSQGKDYEAVYAKRYFSKFSAGGNEFTTATDKAGNTHNIGADVTLKFDPGWNAYYPNMFNARDGMMEDMAVMLVPSDEALDEWFENGNGKIVKDYYGTLDNTPTDVLRQLVNANQFISFVKAVPSQFDHMLDDAGMSLDITLADVDSVFLACNGMVYKTNKVFSPASYRSVYFPAVIDKGRFSMMASAIESLNYEAYLNSMVSRYVFLIPSNEGMASFIDPLSFGKTTGPQMWKFYYEPSEKSGAAGPIKAKVYNCEYVDGEGWKEVGSSIADINKNNDMQYIPFTSSGSSVSKTVLRDRLEYILDNAIVIEPYEVGKQFYKTKSNNYVKIEALSGEDVNVSGALQNSDGLPMPSQGTYTMENGHTYVVNGVVEGTNMSVAKTLAKHAEPEDGSQGEFSKFFSIMEKCGAFTKAVKREKWTAADQVYGNLTNVKDKDVVGNEGANSTEKYAYMLDNYHYTIYAPTDAAMDEAFAMGLPTVEDYEEAEELDVLRKEEDDAYRYTKADSIKEVWLDFVKYHLQSNAVFIDGGSNNKSGTYESGKTEMTPAIEVVDGVSEDALEQNEQGKFIAVTIKGTKYELKNGSSLTKDADGTYSGVEYYTGLYSPGTPYRLRVNVSASDLTVTDNRGNTAHVLTDKGLYNMMATEYWINSYSDQGRELNPYEVQLANYSFAVIHAIDHPLLYSVAGDDKTTEDGKTIPSQFIYVKKPLSVTTSAKRR